MFEKNKLLRAIIANDANAIRAIVAKNGSAILSKRLPVTFSRPPGEVWPGDDNIRGIFKKPPALALALIGVHAATDDLLVELGAAPLQRINANYPNMLFAAAALGRADILADWLDAYRGGAHARNDDNDSLLHIACLHNAQKVVILLLENGFYTTQKSFSDRSPLDYAEATNDRNLIALLHAAEKGAQMPRWQDHGPAPLAVPALPAPEVALNEWHIIDADRIARVTDAPAIGYRLTEIFNFATGEVMRLNRNLETGAESAVISPISQMAQSDVVGDAAERLGRTLDLAQFMPAPARKGIAHKKPE